MADIEKKSLEAHVELCAERYDTLEVRLNQVDDRISSMNKIICEVRDLVQNMATKRNDQLMSWGVSIIAVLVAAVGFLITQFVIK
jgi:uncharacterized protein YydD (DUF2326 family)